MVEREYLAVRAAQELTAAIKATDKRVRDRHLELADAYTFRLREWNRLEAAVRPALFGAKAPHE